MKVRILLLFASILLIGADKPTKKAATKKAAPNPIAPFQGTWSMVSMETRGVRTPDEDLRRLELTIDDHQWTVMNGNIVSFHARFLIDPSQSPKAINLFSMVGDRETLSQGIYSLEGDTLTLARTLDEGARPKEFKTTSEAGVLVVWKKSKR